MSTAKNLSSLVPVEKGSDGELVRDHLEAKHAVAALHQDSFRMLLEAIQDHAIFMLDTGGHVISWNAGAERLKGYRAAEIVGHHFSCFYPEEDRRSGKPDELLKLAATNGRIQDEGWRIRKDGSKFWANVTIAAIKDSAGVLVGFAKVTRDVTQLKQAAQRLADSERSLRQLSRHLLRTQDEERRRIGRDLHDSLGQSLTALKIKLDQLSTSGKCNPSVADKVRECCLLANESIKEVRTISYLMYPPMLEELGLKSAVPWYLDGFSQRSGIRTGFEISSDFDRLPLDAELALFRILQESLTNVHRHSGSPVAVVRLYLREGMAILEISDRGKGLPSVDVERGSQDWIGSLGVGLRGMNERMQQLGGKLEVSSSENGTTVVARIPCQVSEVTTSTV